MFAYIFSQASSAIGSIECFQIALKHGCTIGKSMQFASYFGKTECVEHFLKSKFDIGDSLSYAARSKYENCLRHFQPAHHSKLLISFCRVSA